LCDANICLPPDLHPDEFYKVHAATDSESACHRGVGASGKYGAETSDCDSPHALVNATFKWIAENVKDMVDFVVWTGDSARHDSDEEIPRRADHVLDSNIWMAEKFVTTFGRTDDPKELAIPVIPTFGNNDILPHNILLSGPNKWLKAYSNIWSKFIPEEQRHGFERGGWYYVEVIPGKLAVFSLNTLYFFDNNAAVDGCALRSEPGYEHMEWLRIQLQFMRERGMKAILMGHVPPARTESKQLWDESCWQKYTLWLRQYRDVVVGGLYGHMNIDHFMLQDSKDVKIDSEDFDAQDGSFRTAMDEDLTVQSANDYLEELRKDWSDLPNPNILDETEQAEGAAGGSSKKRSRKDKKKKKAENKLGGPWGERFQVTHVAPSVVPNYFPTLRIFEYNITGLDASAVWANPTSWSKSEQSKDRLEEHFETETAEKDEDVELLPGDQSSGLFRKSEEDSVFHAIINSVFKDDESIAKTNGKKDKKKKKPTNPDLIIPDAPSKSTPPGPGYSPQTLTLLGYIQYYANLTHINNDFVIPRDNQEDADSQKWREGKHKGKKPKSEVPHPNQFKYEVEYDTFNDPIYKLKDMTVKSYIKLAHRIGKYKPQKGDQVSETITEEYVEDRKTEVVSDDKKKHKKKKHHKQKKKNKVWLQFISRAFVGTLEEQELQTFKKTPDAEIPGKTPDITNLEEESHDGEL
jgi:endopolyphosphatase